MEKADKKMWVKPVVEILSVKKSTLHGEEAAHDEHFGYTNEYFPGKRSHS